MLTVMLGTSLLPELRRNEDNVGSPDVATLLCSKNGWSEATLFTSDGLTWLWNS